MEMRIENDKVCLNDLVLENWSDLGKSKIGFQNGIQRDVMCSFRKRVETNPEDPKAQY